MDESVSQIPRTPGVLSVSVSALLSHRPRLSVVSVPRSLLDSLVPLNSSSCFTKNPLLGAFALSYITVTFEPLRSLPDESRRLPFQSPSSVPEIHAVDLSRPGIRGQAPKERTEVSIAQMLAAFQGQSWPRSTSTPLPMQRTHRSALSAADPTTGPKSVPSRTSLPDLLAAGVSSWVIGLPSAPGVDGPLGESQP